MLWHYSKEGKRGIRAWWHFDRSAFKVEFYWWSRQCHASIAVDEDWTLAVALPPLSLYFSAEGFGLWKPQRKTIATWDNNREIWLTDERECSVSVHDWTIRVTPWGRRMEWRKSDPWWIRGVSLNLPDAFLGRHRYTCKTLKDNIPVRIPMPEGIYSGTAKVERQTWKRPLWFTKVRISTWIDVPKGVPFAGKGENSWDCDDDGLFGCGVTGESVERAISHFRESVEASRKRYGRASDESIKQALA